MSSRVDERLFDEPVGRLIMNGGAQIGARRRRCSGRASATLIRKRGALWRARKYEKFTKLADEEEGEREREGESAVIISFA